MPDIMRSIAIIFIILMILLILINLYEMVSKGYNAERFTIICLSITNIIWCYMEGRTANR